MATEYAIHALVEELGLLPGGELAAWLAAWVLIPNGMAMIFVLRLIPSMLYVRERIKLEVVIDVARTPDGARDMLDRVADHGLRDFRIERDRHHSFEVERPFDGLIPALREVRMLHRDGIRAHLELVR